MHYTKKFLFIVPALTPFYLIKISPLGLPTNVFEILAIIALLLSFSQWKHFELSRFYNDNKNFCFGVALIMFGLVTSLLYNKTYAVSLGIFKSWFLLPIIFSFILYSTLKTREDVLFVLKSIFVSITAVAFISLGYKLLGVVTFDGRLQAFYNSPNYLAMFLAPGIFLGLLFYVLEKKCHPELVSGSSNGRLLEMLKQVQHDKGALYISSSVVIILALYFTYSYAAWISILATFVLLFFIKNKSKPRPALLKMAAVFFAVFTILFVSQLPNQKLADVLNQNPRSSLASRTMIWQSSSKMIADSPIFGIGAGNFQKTYLDYQQYFPLYLEWAVPQPHNLFLAFWLQTGVVGLAGFIMVLYCVFSFLIKALQKRRGPDLAYVLLAIFLYISLHGLADTTYWKNDLAFIFWIFAFLTIFLAHESKRNPI